MSAVDNTPSNRNFLSPLGFKFIIKKAPNVNFFVQKVNIPSVDLIQVDTSNPFVRTPYAGDHIDFGTLELSFKVDEDFQNYLEIYNWLQGLGFPERFKQYDDLASKPSYSGETLYSDVSLIVLASTKTSNYEFTFVDAFPISLSSVALNTVDDTVNYVDAVTRFKYTYFTVKNI